MDQFLHTTADCSGCGWDGG